MVSAPSCVLCLNYCYSVTMCYQGPYWLLRTDTVVASHNHDNLLLKFCIKIQNTPFVSGILKKELSTGRPKTPLMCPAELHAHW